MFGQRNWGKTNFGSGLTSPSTGAVADMPVADAAVSGQQIPVVMNPRIYLGVSVNSYGIASDNSTNSLLQNLAVNGYGIAKTDSLNSLLQSILANGYGLSFGASQDQLVQNS